MKSISSLIVGTVLGGIVSTAAVAGPVKYPKPALVSQSAGLMESYVAGRWYRGSAVVAQDPKLIFSCAHLFYERGRWATDYTFYRALHQANYPEIEDGVAPRGMYYFTSYSSGARAYGSESEVAFASDFTVFYGNADFGPAVSCWSNGARALESSRIKRIVGYPSEIDLTGAPGGCYQHATGKFPYDAFRVYRAYHEIDGVSTGVGNSGGPVFVQDDFGRERLAGILVSGTRRSAGVVALTRATQSMTNDALGMPPRSMVFSNTKPRKLPDGGDYVTFPLVVSGFGGTAGKANLSLTVTTKHRGDLMAYVVAPNGRIHWLTKRQGGTADDLVINGLNLVDMLGGASANGTWNLRIRDCASGDVAVFQEASLLVVAR